jgi:uncharacterized protein YjiS (DUF1127 family)
MKHEPRTMSTYRPVAYFDALVEPVNGLSEGILYGFSALRRKLAGAFASWRRSRAIDITVAELSRLDNRTLKDIGVCRDNIYAVAVAVVDDPSASVRDIAGS